MDPEYCGGGGGGGGGGGRGVIRKGVPPPTSLKVGSKNGNTVTSVPNSLCLFLHLLTSPVQNKFRKYYKGRTLPLLKFKN